MRLFSAAAAILVFAACDGTNAPTGLRNTPPGPGVRILWELTGLGLPRMPFPNDALTRADPTSPTGLRLSFPRDTRTLLEDDLRAGLNDLDGFSGSGSILIPFDDAIDMSDVRRRQASTAQLSTSGFAGHAIYLVDLDSGLPVPIGLGAPWTPDALQRPEGYFPRGPRDGEPSLLLETVREESADSDFDGVTDVAATADGVGGAGAELVDRLTGDWERESNTLILRPLLPLTSGARYAVVVTERLRGPAGERIRSPLPFIHPPTQRETLRPLLGHFAAHPELYGDLFETGFEGIAFTWAFTVQSSVGDLFALAQGLDGEGPLRALNAEFSRDSVPHEMSGGLAGRPCPDPGAALYRASGAVFRTALAATAAQLGLGVSERDALVLSYEALDSVVAFSFEAPYLLGNPARPSPISRFSLDRERPPASFRRDSLVAIAFVPRSGTDRRQPFAPLLWVHDAHGSKVDLLAYAGLILKHGIAPVVIDAPEHGLGLSEESRVALLNVFGNQCLAPLGEALMAGRSADFDADGRGDPGAAAHGPDPFHARDLRRQAALDYISLARVLASFDGSPAQPTTVPLRHRREPASFDGDYDRDGEIDPHGDWDGDGTPDLGGAELAIAGIGMGANVATLVLAATPRVTSASPIAPGGGLAQAWMRSGDDRIRTGVLGTVMGPVVWTRRSAGPDTSTSCSEGDVSVRVAAGDLNAMVDIEVACLAGVDAGPGAVAIVRDLTNGAVGCAAFDDEGRTHIPVEADAGDHWSFELYASPSADVNYGPCTFSSGSPQPSLVLETFSVESGPPGIGSCPECARFRRVEYELGTPLLFPAAGLGRRRQSPQMTRYEAVLATAVHAADPLAYVGAPADSHRISITATVGDDVLPIAAAVRLARATTALPFLPPDAPAHLSAWSAVATPTPHDSLAALFTIEGAPWLERTPVTGGNRFLADPDDLSEGRARFASDGSADPSGTRPQTPRILARSPRATLVYIAPEGAHGPDPGRLFSPTTPFDASQYLINHVTRFAATGGREIRHRDVPGDHLCLADSSCEFSTD